MHNKKYTLPHIVCTLGTLLSILCTSTADTNMVNVSVYYESKCSDSMKFFVEQLEPTYKIVGELMNIIPIPYGKARMEIFPNGSFTFECQHGPDECKYNMIHACAIQHTKPDGSMVTKTTLEFLTCLMKEQNEDMCARKSGVDLNPILACSKSEEGQALMYSYACKTENFTPKITYVPTVVFNDVYNKDDQSQAEKNLLKVVCKYLDPKPDVCEQQDISVIQIT